MNPGSGAAVCIGCSCPPSENDHGLGLKLRNWYGPALDFDKGTFLVNQSCPIHGQTRWLKGEEPAKKKGYGCLSCLDRGWGVFNDREIQRCDSCKKFKNDDEAAAAAREFGLTVHTTQDAFVIAT